MGMISALADYAAIALENARKYLHSEAERNKLETILEEIEEGVIVVDQDRRIVMINRKACESFDVEDKLLVGKRIREVIDHPDLLDVLRDKDQIAPCCQRLLKWNRRQPRH